MDTRLSPSTHWQTNPAQAVASPSAQSSNLFQNAAGFSIVGGQFVSGDVHNHPGEGKAHGHFPNPRNNSLPIPSFNILDDNFSESEIYCNQLMRRRRGFPLYVPGPPENLPEEYRRHGVAIGDVGSITPEGIFDFYFNVYLPADHPINDNDVPEDFCPLIPYTPKDLTYLSYDPGDSVSTSSVAKLTPPSEEFPGGDFAFRCDAPQGAVLALPHGAHLKKLKNLETLREYAAFHAESWYKYINGTGGRGLQNGSLYLVTGCEKAHSWGTASFYGTSDEFQLKFSQMPPSNRYRWRGVQGSRYPSQHKSYEPSSIGSTPSNQTTFIHGLSISLGVGIWGKVFGTKVGIREIVESRLGGANGYGNMSQPSGSSSFSWSLGLFGGGGSTGGKSYAGENRNVVLSDFPPVLKIFHPAEIINNYLLEKSPNATVVMSHDDDWSDILADDPHTGSQIRTVPELLKGLDALNIIEKKGAAYLQPRSHNDAGSTAQFVSENHLYALPFLPTQGSYRNEARHKMATRSEHLSYDIYLELGLRYPEFESKADSSRNIINASSYVSSHANSGYGGSSAAGQHPFIKDASFNSFRNAGFFTTSHPHEYHNNALTYNFSAATSPPPLTAASLSATTGVAPPPAPPNQGYYLPRSTSQSASQGKAKRLRPEPVNNENKDDDMDGDMEEGGAHAKPLGACARCKQLKVKCEFKTEADPCKRCFNGGHDCVTPGRKKRRTPPKREHLLNQIREQAAEIQKLMTQLEETNARHARVQNSVATDAFPLTPSSGGGLHSPSSDPVKPESDVAANKAVEDWIAKARDSLAEFDGFIGGAGIPKSYLVKEDLEDSSTDDEDDNDGEAGSGGAAPESTREYWIEVIDSEGEDVTQKQAVKDSGYAELATLPSEASPFGLMAALNLKKSRAESPELDSSGAPALGVANDNFFRSTPDPMRSRPFDGGPAAPHILTRGLITPQEAEKLFDIYFQRMNLSVSLLDPILYTPQKTCYRSPFLFTVVCAIASRFYTERPELYPQAMHFAELAAGTALISGHKCVELCQGYILLSLYPVPAKHWEEERGWLYLGLAIRMAMDLNLHLPSTAQPINESHAREMLNRTRVWLNCFNLDRSTGSQYGKAPTISNNDYLANHSENWWRSSPFNMANFDIHICAYNSEVKVMSALMAKIYSDPTGLNKNVQVDFQAIATETDEELKQLRDRWRAILDQTDMTDPQNKFRSGLIGLSYSYARLVVLSFGFQDAFEKNHVDENPFFNPCLAAATDVVHTFINEVGSPDQRIYLRHGPIAQSVFVTFAASMLVKLLQPKFTSYLSIDKQREIRGLVKQVIDLLGSPDVSVDGEHGPNLYARFLQGLLAAPFAKGDAKPSRTPMRSNSGQPMDGGDAPSPSMRASVDLFVQGGRGLGLEVDISPPDFFPPSLPYNQDPLQGMQGIVSGWSDDFSWLNQRQNQSFVRTTEGMYNEQSY